MPDLGILIVTLKRRRPYMARLMRRLEPQLSERVEVFTLEDEGAESIGVKRQRLLTSEHVSPCRWTCFIDDDDLVSEDYCASILGALDQDPDVVGFRLRYYEDGRPRGTSVHSLEHNPYKRWATARHPRTREQIHYRTPNHLNPVRLEMARAVGFPDRQSGEDAEFSRGLYKKFPQMKEVFIDKHLYSYYYRTPRLRKESEDLQIEDVPC
jgi:hypothetical protein